MRTGCAVLLATASGGGQHHTHSRCHAPLRHVPVGVPAPLEADSLTPLTLLPPAGVSFIDQLKLMGSYMGLLDLD